MSHNRKISKEDILKQISEAKWDKEVMTCAIAAKIEKRTKKGNPFQCFVLERKDPEEGEDELISFLTQLKKNIENVRDGTRFQLAIKTGEHWTACDMLIKKGCPEIFILDAANTQSALAHLDEALNKIFPGMKTYCYVPDQIIDPTDPREVRDRLIQFDNTSCSFFTLDHIFHLSKVNVFQYLHEAKLKGLRSIPNYFKVNPENCPPQLAFLFRNTQSWTVIDSLPNHLKTQVVNKKGQTLLQSILSHSQEVKKDDKPTKKLNKSANYKREKFSQSVVDFIADKNDKELNHIIQNRTGAHLFKLAEKKESKFEVKDAKTPFSFFGKSSYSESQQLHDAKIDEIIDNLVLVRNNLLQALDFINQFSTDKKIDSLSDAATKLRDILVINEKMSSNPNFPDSNTVMINEILKLLSSKKQVSAQCDKASEIIQFLIMNNVKAEEDISKNKGVDIIRGLRILR